MADLIDRQAAIDALGDMPEGDDDFDTGCRQQWNWDTEAIKALPSAQPERKKGRWIHDGYAFKGGIDWMHCSECGHKDSWSAATRTPFCAWCGKRMEGEG